MRDSAGFRIAEHAESVSQFGLTLQYSMGYIKMSPIAPIRCNLNFPSCVERVVVEQHLTVQLI